MAPKETTRQLRPPLPRIRKDVPTSKRTLSPGATSSKSKAQKTRNLEPPEHKKELRSPQVYSRPFNLMEVPLVDTSARVTKDVMSSESESSSSEESEGEKRKRKERSLTIRKRAKEIVDAAMEYRKDGGRGEMTFLEHRAIGRAAARQYAAALQAFEDYAAPHNVDVKDPENVDHLLVQYLNKLYADGEMAYLADRTIAGWMHQHAQYGRSGSMKMPRT